MQVRSDHAGRRLERRSEAADNRQSISAGSGDVTPDIRKTNNNSSNNGSNGFNGSNGLFPASDRSRPARRKDPFNPYDPFNPLSEPFAFDLARSTERCASRAIR